MTASKGAANEYAPLARPRDTVGWVMGVRSSAFGWLTAALSWLMRPPRLRVAPVSHRHGGSRLKSTPGARTPWVSLPEARRAEQPPGKTCGEVGVGYIGWVTCTPRGRLSRRPPLGQGRPVLVPGPP